MAVEDAYELAYREAVRALEHRSAALTELRGRASMLLAAASIALSLLSGEAFDHMRPAAWTAIVCFALLSICVVVIMWPYDDWSVDFDSQSLLLAHLSRERPAIIDLQLELIAHMARYGHVNGRRLAQVARVFRLGACLLAIQIVLTVVAASGIV